jgi:archaellum component FlaC
VEAGIVSLCLIVTLLGLGCWSILHDSHRVHERINGLERKVNELSSRVNTVARDSKIAHERLVEDLLRRGSEEIDQEIEKARERGRGF